MSVIGEIDGTLAKWAPWIHRCTVRVNTRAELQQRLVGCKQRLARYDIVVIVAHSGTQGIRLTNSPNPMPWNVAANWLSSFQPTTVVLVACQGASELPSASMFGGIRSLDELWGTPSMVSVKQAPAVGFLVLARVVAGLDLPHDLDPFAAGAILALTGEVMLCHTRNDFNDGIIPQKVGIGRLLALLARGMRISADASRIGARRNPQA